METPNGITIAHDDHGLSEEHLRLIDERLSEWDGSFVLIHTQIPEGYPPLPSALYGPAAGDAAITEGQVVYKKRGGRAFPSRLIELPNRPARNMVIVAGPGRGGPIIYTAYGTQADSVSPREPWDKSMNDEERAEAEAFWSKHALSTQ